MKRIAFIILMLSCVFTTAQQATITNMVFEAAGIRGIAYCGAIQEMESKKLMNNIEKVGGTSSGAIMALAVALGYSGDEIEKLIGVTNFRKFNDGNYLFVGGISRMKKYFGWYRGKKLEKWLSEMIAQKTGDPNITFAGLHSKGF